MLIIKFSISLMTNNYVCNSHKIYFLCNEKDIKVSTLLAVGSTNTMEGTR